MGEVQADVHPQAREFDGKHDDLVSCVARVDTARRHLLQDQPRRVAKVTSLECCPQAPAEAGAEGCWQLRRCCGCRRGMPLAFAVCLLFVVDVVIAVVIAVVVDDVDVTVVVVDDGADDRFDHRGRALEHQRQWHRTWRVELLDEGQAAHEVVGHDPGKQGRASDLGDDERLLFAGKHKCFEVQPQRHHRRRVWGRDEEPVEVNPFAQRDRSSHRVTCLCRIQTIHLHPPRDVGVKRRCRTKVAVDAAAQLLGGAPAVVVGSGAAAHKCTLAAALQGCWKRRSRCEDHERESCE